MATEKWLEAGVKLSSKASAVLKTLIATIARKDIQTKIIIFLAILAAYRYASESILIGKVNIPAEGFATPLPPQECTGSEDLTIDTVCSDPNTLDIVNPVLIIDHRLLVAILFARAEHSDTVQ